MAMPIPAPEPAMTKLINAMRSHNVFPIYLDWVTDDEHHPVKKLLDQTLSEMNIYLESATDEELKAAHSVVMDFYRDGIPLDKLLQHDRATIEHMAFVYVVSLTQERYLDYAYLLTDKYREQSVVLKAHPELGEAEDHEGLIPLSTPGLRPNRFGGVLHYRGDVIYYHQFLRRHFTSNPNAPFLLALADYYKTHPNQRVAVAIDHSRLVQEKWYMPIMEKSRSFGPPLSLDRLDDRDYVGLTIHEPTPDTWLAFEFERTEFYWSYRDGIKTFEIEEIRKLPSESGTRENLILIRYVHSQRDLASRAFTHLDGAVKVYSRDEYRKRLALKMPQEQRVRHKPKVFRIDGVIADDDWSRLIGYFYQNNEMVAEYLNPNFIEEG